MSAINSIIPSVSAWRLPAGTATGPSRCWAPSAMLAARRRRFRHGAHRPLFHLRHAVDLCSAFHRWFCGHPGFSGRQDHVPERSKASVSRLSFLRDRNFLLFLLCAFLFAGSSANNIYRPYCSPGWACPPARGWEPCCSSARWWKSPDTLVPQIYGPSFRQAVVRAEFRNDAAAVSLLRFLPFAPADGDRHAAAQSNRLHHVYDGVFENCTQHCGRAPPPPPFLW